MSSPRHVVLGLIVVLFLVVFASGPLFAAPDIKNHGTNFGVSQGSSKVQAITAPVSTAATGPSITSISPASGLSGSSITITGGGFGSTQGTSIVRFFSITSNVIAQITSWSDSSIVAVVPVLSSLPSATFTVRVTVGGVIAQSGFFLTNPAIYGKLLPSTASSGTVVSINGFNFGSSQGTSTVTVGGIVAQVTSWNAGLISFVVPSNVPTGSNNVQVKVGGVGSNTSVLTVSSNPFISYFGPPFDTGSSSLDTNSAPVGQEITINGANFGASQGSSTVTFNGVNAIPTSWSAQAITVPVPTGATTGKIVVKVNGVASNGVEFMVTPPIQEGGVGFVQGSYSSIPVCDGSNAFLVVSFPADQLAGDLNVVVYSWRDAVPNTIQQTDLSIAKTFLQSNTVSTSGYGQTAILYQPNAEGGASTLVTTWNWCPTSPEIRIAEYKGVSQVSSGNPATDFDGTPVLQASSASIADSGFETTTNQNDLLIGIGTAGNSDLMTAPGTNYTNRVITPSGDILEDRIVTSTGSYDATATMSASGKWVMAMLAAKELPNQAPVVDAGPGQTINLPANTVTLDGTATDDGLPNNTLTISWTKVSGPGTVTFSSPSTASTQATFSTFGTYVLQLTANDSQLSSSSNVTVTVNPEPISLVLTPLSAGPDVTGTTQKMTALLKNGTGPTATPISAVSVQFTVTGANATGGTSTTDATGTATFTYTGAHSGTDTVQASYTGQNSNSVNVNWLVPTQTISTSPILGQFFTYDGNYWCYFDTPGNYVYNPQGGTLTYPPPATPLFTQTFPTIDFNPPSGAVPGNTSGVNIETRPFTDVTTDFNGNFSGTIVAQGNGYQAGLLTLNGFEAVFTGSFTVAAPSQLTLTLYSDDGFLFGVGNGAYPPNPNTNILINEPSPGVTPFTSLPFMATLNNPNAASGNPVVVNFPKAGMYPFELDYVECRGGALSLTMTSGNNATGIPPTGSISLSPISPSSLAAGQSQTFTAAVTDASGAALQNATVDLTVYGANQRQLSATTDATGHATFQYTGTNAGTDTVQASGVISGMGAYSNIVNMAWTVPAGGGVTTFVPQGWIGSPTRGTIVRGQLPITVASGVNLTSGTLSYWPTSNPAAVTILNSNTTGTGTIGTFDATTLASGGYTIQLNATANGTTQGSQVTVTVVGANKPGRMTSTVTEFKVPLAGIPISITRTYDSLERNLSEDFGFGWKLGTTVGLSVDANLNVTFNFNGQRQTFFFAPQPSSFWFAWLQNAQYVPEPGLHGTLISDGCPSVINVQGTWQCFGPGLYQPTVYAYTDPSGRTYTITATGQLQSIKDLNGNTLTITPNGITSSVNGVVIPFVRDGTGRITKITDLSGNNYIYSYDASGNLQSVQYPGLTAAETYSYATDHSLLTETDPRGNTSTAVYYSSANDGGNSLLDGRLFSITDTMQNTTNFSYTLSSNTTTTTLPDGGVQTRTDDSFGKPLSVTDPLNRTTTYTYDAKENVISMVDPLQNPATTYTYDANGFQTSIHDPLGHTSTKTYNQFGGVLTATDAANTNTQTTTYDANFNPSQVTDLLNGAGTQVTSSSYDSLGNLLTSTDANGKTTEYAYDPNGNLIQVTDALNQITHYAYDAMDRLISQTDPLGNTTQFSYDALGRLTKKTDALNKTTTYVYDNNGNKTSETDANNHTTSYQYDNMNRVSKITYPDTTFKTFTYDFRGNKLTEVDQSGRTTKYVYDLAGQLTSMTYAFGTSDAGTVSYTYDLDGRTKTIKDELNNTTTNNYDAAGRLTSVQDALTHLTNYSYDADNRKTSVQDANGNTTSYAYDARSRLTTITYPATATQGITTTRYTYDGMGRLLTTTDQASKVTTKTYDAVGRLLSVKDALNNLTQYTYDLNANLKFLRDAAGRVTSYQYDALNRRATRTLPLNQSEFYTYDPVGNLATKTDFNGLQTTYSYDTLNRLLSKVPSSGTGISFTYTATGQRLSMTDPSGTTNYSSYDNRDRLKTKATPEGTLTYTYDAHGNVLTINSSNTNGASMTYTYDALNRLASAKDNRIAAQGGPSTPTTYSYDPVGNLSGYAYPNTVQTGNVFDQLNRLTQTCEATTSPACSAGTKLASYAYTLGNAGNRTNVLELSNRNVAYGYDNDYRLSSEAITADPGGNNGTVNYVYDVVGNRASMTSTLNAVPGGSFFFDNDDRLTTDTYDNNGNTIFSTGVSNTYDFENRMTAHGAVTLVYDGDGNRISETAGGTTTKYLVDTLNPTGYSQVMDELVNGSVTRTYAYGLQRASENQLVGSTWTPSFYDYDGHGNVRFLTNSAGTINDTYQYDAFGMPITSAGTTSNNYLYSGERSDNSVGLYDLRARYYNQATGRFWARDPVEGIPCSPLTYNAYIYGNDEPVDSLDPTGRQAIIEYLLLYHWIQGFHPNLSLPCPLSPKPLPPPTGKWTTGQGLQICCRDSKVFGWAGACHCFLKLDNGSTLGGSFFDHFPFLAPSPNNDEDNHPDDKGMMCRRISKGPCDDSRVWNAFNDLPKQMFYGDQVSTSNSTVADILRRSGVPGQLPPCAWGRKDPYRFPPPTMIPPIIPVIGH